MKVFKVRDLDWIAANNELEAISFYKECMEYSDQDMLNDEISAKELLEGEMIRLKHTGDCSDPYPNPITFKEELQKELKAGQNTPWLFASSEF